MKRVLADSYYFFALLNPREPQHQRALSFAQNYRDEIVVTAWILTELGDGLAQPKWRAAFLALVDELRSGHRVVIIPCEQSLMESGLDLYRRRPDKEWSLTNCISFVVMERDGIREALTGDHHFEQAGFVALLK
jgi:predicted nucleic acid-binding protein